MLSTFSAFLSRKGENIVEKGYATEYIYATEYLV